MNNTLSIKSKFQSLYAQPEIGEYIFYTRNNTIKDICTQALILTEANDTLCFINLLTKLSLIKLSSLATKRLELLVLCCNRMLISNQFNQKLIQSILIFLQRVFSLKGKPFTLSLDWKLYYKIYFIETQDSYEFIFNKPETTKNYIDDFYKKAVKFYKGMTKEDYEFIKEEALQHLYHNRIERGLNVLLYFAPKRFIEQDAQLQSILLKLIKTQYSVMNSVCKLFHIILLKNGQLKVDIEEFIQVYFNYLFRYITGKTGGSTYAQTKKGRTNNPNNKTDSFIESICASLLFHRQFSQHRQIIDEHFRLLIPTIHLNLKEKYADKNGNKVIQFLLNLTFSIRSYFYDKQLKDEEAQLFLFTLKDKDIELKERYKVFMSYLHPIIQNFFLFDIKYSSIILERLFDIVSKEEFDKEILHKLRFLLENPEICTRKFIQKINCVIVNLLNKKNFKGDIAAFITEGINFMIDNLSSINSLNNVNILRTLSKIYNYCSTIKNDKEYTDNASISKLFELLNTKSIVIIKKILPIFDMLTSNLNAFNWFYSSMLSFITDDNKKNVSAEFSSFIIENELDIKYLPHYFIGVSNSKQLWLHCFESLITIEDKEDVTPVQKPKWLLYDFNKDIYPTKLEVNIHNEQRLLYFKEILSNIDFSDCELNDKTKKQFKTLLYVLLYQKDKKYQDLAFALFDSMAKSLLQAHQVKDLIEYPKEIDVVYANEIITSFIMPYQNYLNNLLDSIDNQIGKEKSKSDKKKEGKLFFNQLIEDDYEKKLFIYLNYQHTFMTHFNNIFVNDNKAFPTNKHVDINSLFSKTLEQYALINNHISQFNQFNHRLVNFNKCVPGIKSIHILNVLYANIDSQIHQIKPIKEDSTVKAVILYAKSNLTIPSCYSLYEKLFNKKRFLEHILHFRHISEKRSIVDNMKLLLSSYDSSIKYSAGEMYHNLLHQPEKEVSRLIKEMLLVKYLKDLRKIKDNSVSEQTKMDVIVGNAISLIRLLLLLEPYSHIEATNSVLSLVNVLSEKNYAKMNVVYPELEKVLRVIRESMLFNGNYIENKLSAYPQIKGLKFDDNQDCFYYNKKKEKLLTQIANQQKESKENRDTFERQITEKINHYYNALYSNELSANNTMLMMNVFCNSLIILNRLNVNDKANLEQFDNYAGFILSKVIESNTTYEMKKFFFDMYGRIIKHKVKAYKKYIITEYSKDYYVSNQIELMKNAKRFLQLNDYPVKWLHKTSYLPIESERDDSQKKFEGLCHSIYQIKDWLNDKVLMEKQQGGSLLMQFLAHQNNTGTGLDETIQNALSKHMNPGKKMLGHYSMSNSLPLLKRTEALSFFYLIQHCPIEFTYEMVYNYYDPYINNKAKEDKSDSKTAIVSLVCLLEMLIGLIRNDVANGKYQEAQKAIKRVLNYYTNGINMQTDMEIVVFLQMIFSKCSLREMKLIFPFDKDNLEDANELHVDLFIILGYLYPSTLHFNLRENPEYAAHIKKIFASYQSDYPKIISNRVKFISFIKAFLYGFRLLIDDPLQFTTDSTQEAQQMLLSLASSKQDWSAVNPEVIEMLAGVLLFNCDLFLQDIELFNAYLKPFVYLASKEDRYSSLMKQLETLFHLSRKPVDLVPMMKLLLNSISIPQGQKGRLLVLSMIQLLFQLNIHFNIDLLKRNDLFNTFAMVLDSIDSELKDSFSEFFVYYYEMIREEDNIKVINIYRTSILNEKIEDDALMKEITDRNISKQTITYLALTQLLRFRTEMPEYIQRLILDSNKYFNKMNNKGEEAKVIKSIIMKAMDRYHNGYVFLQSRISEECHNALTEISRNNSYFI